MDHIGSHISRVPSIPTKKSRATERGELMRYFKLQLNKTRARDGLELITMPRMGKIFEAIPTKDLYYLKSVCDQHADRGGDFSKKFWFEIDPKKHTKEAIAKRVPFKNSTKGLR